MSDKQIEPQDTSGNILATSEEIGFMQDTMEALLVVASADAVYSEPVKKGDHLIIPAAEVLAGAGFGFGSGSGGSSEENGHGVGGGGGGRTFARPVAVIIASPEGVRVEPVVDVTKLGLAFLTAGIAMVGLMMKMLQPEKTLKDLQEGNV